MAKKAKWTILTYIAAHNNLDNLGLRSLRQINQVGSTSDVMHGVLYDGTKGAARYIVGDPGLMLQEEKLSDFDSGDPDTLVETARWLFEQYPAERYGLVLWSHGSGWRPEEIETVAKQVRGDDDYNDTEERAFAPDSLILFRSSLGQILQENEPGERAILFDDGSGHSLDTLELQRVMQQIENDIGQPLDLLGMDACLMASLEVAYQIRHSVNYLVASEELVPGNSWPYDLIYGELKSNPEYLAKQLAVSIVNQYMDFYRANPPSVGDVTKIALDLSTIDKVAQAVDNLAQVLIAEMDDHGDLLWEIQNSIEARETQNGDRRDSKFNYHLWDIGSLATALNQHDQASETVQKAAQAVNLALSVEEMTVLEEGHMGEWFDGIGGVSIYMVPPNKRRISPTYSMVALAEDTAWDEMLVAYHDHFPPM